MQLQLTRDCVLTSLIVKNHDEMVENLKNAGIEFTHKPHYSEALEIKSLLFRGPEGYMFEVEEFLNPKDIITFYNKEEEEIDDLSKTIGIMTAFSEVIACGVKDIALGVPVTNRNLRDKHMVYAKKIAKDHDIYCCEENGGFLTDLFPASMNRDKYNILFYKDDDSRDKYFYLKNKKEELVKNDEYKGDKRYQIAYDFGILLSYSDSDIKRMIKENDDLE